MMMVRGRRRRLLAGRHRLEHGSVRRLCDGDRLSLQSWRHRRRLWDRFHFDGRAVAADDRLLRSGFVRLGRFREIAAKHAFDDSCAMLVDRTHVGRRANAHLTQEGDRIFARQIELFCELVNPYRCHDDGRSLAALDVLPDRPLVRGR
jgi:hypothetical protein